MLRSSYRINLVGGARIDGDEFFEVEADRVVTKLKDLKQQKQAQQMRIPFMLTLTRASRKHPMQQLQLLQNRDIKLMKSFWLAVRPKCHKLHKRWLKSMVWSPKSLIPMKQLLRALQFMPLVPNIRFLQRVHIGWLTRL